MKTTLSIFAALMIFSHVMFAGIDRPEVVTGMAVMKQGVMVKLFYKGTRQSDVKVTIYNASNKRVFTETIRRVDNFIRPYNFSNLEQGEYLIELVGEDGRQVERVNYTLEKVEKLANVLRVYGEKDKYMLTVSNKGSEVITVKIYTLEGKLVYNESESVTGDFARLYNLENYKDSVIFEVSDSKGITKMLSL